MKKSSKVAGYIRVSTVGQAEHGHGLDNQEEAIHDFCQAQGFELVRIYREEGVSGGNGIEGREALPHLLKDLEDGAFQGVVIVRLDRLARDLLLQEYLIGEVRKLGAKLLSIAEPDLCSDDSTRTLIRQILGAVSEYEKKLIVARLAGGRRRKVRQGGYPGGWVPMGYRVEGEGREASVVAHEAETEIVRRIFEDYAGGKTMREIAADLDGDAVPTRRGGKWAAATVGAILGNPFYTGREKVEGQVRRDGHPAIIEQKLFGRCEQPRKKALRRRPKMAARDDRP